MKWMQLLVLIIISSHCFSQSFISKESAMDDIDFYNETLQDVHYNPFLFTDKNKYFAEAEALKKSLPDSISIYEFITVLYRLSAILKDGHNSPFIVQPIIIDELKKEQFFPYSLIPEKNKLYVLKNSSGPSSIPAGAEIVSVNQINMSSLLPKMQTWLGGNKPYTEEMTGRLLSYFLFLAGITAPFQVQYTDPSGAKMNKTITTGIKFKDALALTMPHIKQDYDFKLIEGKLGYINFMSMSGEMNPFNHFLDSCINLVKKEKIKNIVIDLRNNSGGNSALGDLLFSYITTKKYTLMGGRKWKISAQYKDYLLSNGDSTNEYLQKENGSIWELGNCEAWENRFKNNNIFEGKVWMLTGPFTFSSANMIADGAKQFKIAELVGEPTGENTNDFGETYVFPLPNSKIKMQTTTSFDYGANCDKTSHEPVKPDKTIDYDLKDRINGTDRDLEYILKHIK